MTQPEFAQAVGVVNQSTVSDWERNVKSPDIDTLERMVKLIDENFTLDKCLRLPTDETAIEVKYRRILAIIADISPAKLVEPPKPKTVRAGKLDAAKGIAGDPKG